MQLITVWKPDGWRNFARTSTIRQGQVGLKQWILGHTPSHRGKSSSSTQGVSGKLGIILFSEMHHPYDQAKSIWDCWIVSRITKILQNLLFTLVDNSKCSLFHGLLPLTGNYVHFIWSVPQKELIIENSFQSHHIPNLPTFTSILDMTLHASDGEAPGLEL